MSLELGVRLGDGLQLLALSRVPATREKSVCLISLTLTHKDLDPHKLHHHLSSLILPQPRLPSPGFISLFFFTVSENGMEEKNVVGPAASTYALQS